MRGLTPIYNVRMAQFVLKIEKLSHIMGPRASQDLRSPSPIMAPGSSMNVGKSNHLASRGGGGGGRGELGRVGKGSLIYSLEITTRRVWIRELRSLTDSGAITLTGKFSRYPE